MKVRVTFFCGRVEVQTWPPDTSIVYSMHSIPGVKSFDILAQ